MVDSLEEKRYSVIDGKKFYRYHTLFVTEEGKVYKSPFDKPIVPKDNAIWFREENPERDKNGKKKRKKYQTKKIVYEAITGTEVKQTHKIVCIDGNEENCAFDNLKLVAVKDITDLNKFKKYYKISEETREQIKENKHNLTVPQLADFYSTTPATITKILSGNTGRDWYKIKNDSNEELESEQKTS